MQNQISGDICSTIAAQSDFIMNERSVGGFEESPETVKFIKKYYV